MSSGSGCRSCPGCSSAAPCCPSGGAAGASASRWSWPSSCSTCWRRAGDPVESVAQRGGGELREALLGRDRGGEAELGGGTGGRGDDVTDVAGAVLPRDDGLAVGAGEDPGH